MAGLRAKQSKCGPRSSVSIYCIQGMFDRYVFHVTLRQFGAFPISTNLYIENGWS